MGLKKLIVTMLAIMALWVAPVLAKDQVARVDRNGNPTMIGVSTTTAEIRWLKTTDDGALYVAASNTVTVSLATTTVNIGNTVPVTGTMSYTPQLVTAFDYGYATVAYTATGSFDVSAAATATSFILVNESSTSTVRWCIGCTISSTTGLLLDAGATIGMDQVQINPGAGLAVNYYGVDAAPATLSIVYGRKP